MKWLDWLTRPVQKLFNLLSFRRKFSLIGFLLFIPVIVLSSLMVNDSLEKVIRLNKSVKLLNTGQN